MVGTIRSTLCKDNLILITGIYEYVTLHGKKDFTNVIQVMDLKMGDYSGLSWWDHSKYMSFLK